MDSPPGLEDVRPWLAMHVVLEAGDVRVPRILARDVEAGFLLLEDLGPSTCLQVADGDNVDALVEAALTQLLRLQARSEEHTSELQSLMRISYAVFCLKKKINN